MSINTYMVSKFNTLVEQITKQNATSMVIGGNRDSANPLRTKRHDQRNKERGQNRKTMNIIPDMHKAVQTGIPGLDAFFKTTAKRTTIPKDQVMQVCAMYGIDYEVGREKQVNANPGSIKLLIEPSGRGILIKP